MVRGVRRAVAGMEIRTSRDIVFEDRKGGLLGLAAC